MELIMSDDNKYYGTVIWFCPKKGMGFLAWEKDNIKQKDMFVHFSDIEVEGFKTLYKDNKVSFKIGLNVRGIVKAICVEVLKN